MAKRKSELFDVDLARISSSFRLLGHPARLAILEELAADGRCRCGEICSQLPLAQATISQHLKQLREGGLIAGEISGPSICYCINPEKLGELVSEGTAFLSKLKQQMPIANDCNHKETYMMNSNTEQAHAEEIKTAVRARYRESAEKGSCCDTGPSCGCGSCNSDVIVDSTAYAALDGYVADADLGLGCGIPTQFANIKAGETVLDLGSGAGNDVFIAAKYVGEAGHVIGVDMTPEMIGKARGIARDRGFTNVEFRLGEIEALPVADNTIDLVLSNCVVNLVPDKSRVFAELARVLKTGGRFVISDIVTTGVLPDEILQSMAQYVGGVAGASLITDYESMMKAAGFSRIEIAERRVIDPSSWAGDSKSVDGVDVLSVTFVAYK